MCEQFSFCDVISYSPNNTLLNSIQELKNYLTSKGACICGLKLPFSVEEVFSFDPKVIGLQEQLDEEELRQHIYRQPTLIGPTSDGQQKVIGHVPIDSDSPPSEGDLPYDATALTVSAGTAGKTENDIPFFAKMSSSSHSEVVSIIRNVDKCYQKVSPPELDNTRAPISTLNKGSKLSENNIPTSTSEIVSEQVEVECSNPDEFEPTMLTENMCDEIIKAISTGIEEGKLSSVECDAYEPLPNVDNINVYHNEYKIGTDFIESENLSIASPSKFPAFSLSPLTFPTEEFVSTPTLATPTSLLPVSGTTWTTTVSSHISASCLPTSLLGTTTSGPEPPSSILTPPNSASFHPDPFVTSPCSPSKSPSDMTSEIPISPQGVLDHIFSSDISVRDTLSDPNALNSSLQAVYSSVVEISTSPPLRSFSVDKIEERQEEITGMEEEIVMEKAREEDGLDNEGTMDGAETIDDAETMDEAETVHNTKTIDDAEMDGREETEVDGREETEVEDGINDKKKTAYTRKTHKQKKSFICESNAKLYEELKNCYQLDSIV